MSDDELLEKIAALEGQLTALRRTVAILIHHARTGMAVDEVHRAVQLAQQLVDDGTQTLFPDKRIFFLMTLRDGTNSDFRMADAIDELITGHNSPPTN